MRKIEKGDEPNSLKAFKRANPHGSYNDLTVVERSDIRRACTQEQFFLCAYCCQPISGDNNDTMNEHVEAQKLAPHRTVDFNNIVASCKAPRQCDAAHKGQKLELTPMMSACETELRFMLSGRVEGRTHRAAEAIRVLNLGDNEENNKALIEKRKHLVDQLIWSQTGNGPEDISIEDPELLEMLIDDLSRPIEGRLDGFAPVLINILRGYLDD